MLRIIKDSFTGCCSQVYLNGHVSEHFVISQGTRQGSILAPFYYTVFVDDLLKELKLSNSGLRIADVILSSPTQADDIVLLSLTKHGLGNLLDICKQYASRWRYSYNASKCASMVMGLSSNHRPLQKINLSYGSHEISSTRSYKHLGTIQSVNGKLPFDVDDIRQSIRGTLFSILNRLTANRNVNPLILNFIYRVYYQEYCMHVNYGIISLKQT